jgi:hypothetical protein
MPFVPQIPDERKAPPRLPPAPFEEPEVISRVISVNMQVALDSYQIRLDTGEYSIKYRALVAGVGNVPSVHHGKLSPSQLNQLLSRLANEIISLHA